MSGIKWSLGCKKNDRKDQRTILLAKLGSSNERVRIIVPNMSTNQTFKTQQRSQLRPILTNKPLQKVTMNIAGP
jgi:hypothetical protein